MECSQGTSATLGTSSKSFQRGQPKMQRHAQQTTNSQGYGSAFNAQTDDDNSIASTIANMNVKHAKTLEAFSKLSQSSLPPKRKASNWNRKLQYFEHNLPKPTSIQKTHPSMGLPLMTPQTRYQPPPMSTLPPIQYYAPQQD